MFVLMYPEVLVDLASASVWLIPDYMTGAAQRVIKRLEFSMRAFFRRLYVASSGRVEYLALAVEQLEQADAPIAQMALGNVLDHSHSPPPSSPTLIGRVGFSFASLFASLHFRSFDGQRVCKTGHSDALPTTSCPK